MEASNWLGMAILRLMSGCVVANAILWSAGCCREGAAHRWLLVLSTYGLAQVVAIVA